MNLDKWINENTKGSDCVVEFGSMFFQRLSCVHASVGKKIGIEIWQPYIDNAKYHNCFKIQGDIKDFENLIDEEDMDCLLIVDVLEHLETEEALSLIDRAKDRFNKILLFVPEGNHPQDSDYFSMGADEYQTHRSTWFAEDVSKMSFQTIRVPDYHKNLNKDPGAIFATWETEQ